MEPLAPQRQKARARLVLVLALLAGCSGTGGGCGASCGGAFVSANPDGSAVRFTGQDSEINVASPGDGHKAEFVTWH